MVREAHVANFRRRYRWLVGVALVLMIDAFLLYGVLGAGWWLGAIMASLVAVGIVAAWRQESVGCPNCRRCIYRQEHFEVGRPKVFVCERCEARVTTDDPVEYGG